MKQHDSKNTTTAEKILLAAAQLFAQSGFAAVPIKSIAAASGSNSALISYYFGGKKNLYQEVLFSEAEKFLNLQNKIRQRNESPLDKLRIYVEAIAEMQQESPYNIHLIYRELLAPQPMFENYVRSKLYRVHQFMAELVEEAVKCGEIHTDIKATHVAFTLEGIIMFFFMMQNQVQELGNFPKGSEMEYLLQALNTYLASLKKN